MIDIVTDSCSDLSPKLIERFGIRIIPLQVFLAGKNYADGELSLQELFSLVEKTKELPKTSAPSIPSFIDFFKRDNQVLYIGLSSRLSATMQNARLAADQLPNQETVLIDSLNLSTGIGLLTLLAADLRDAGCSLDEIAAQVQAAVPNVRTAFIIDTMEYIYKGGRCTAIQAIAGSLLSIRPMIHVQPDGTLGVKEKIRGSRKKGLNALLESFRKDQGQADLRRVFVTHTGCDEDASYLVEELKKIAPIENIYTTYAGATIASHCGPNTIGILYLLK